MQRKYHISVCVKMIIAGEEKFLVFGVCATKKKEMRNIAACCGGVDISNKKVQKCPR